MPRPLSLSLLSSCDLLRTNIECPCCGREVAREDTVAFAGAPHCADCVHTCEDCEYVTTDSDELVESYVDSQRHGDGESRRTCVDCRWRCADCSEWFTDGAEQAANASGDDICCQCADQYSHCEACRDMVHEDDAHSNNGWVYCASCYDALPREEDESSRTRDDDGRAVIHPHSSKPEPLFFDAGRDSASPYPSPNVPYFGVEIEVDRSAKADRVADIEYAGLYPSSFYYCEEDGSLDMGGGDSGFEVISEPATWQYWQSCKLEWMGKLRERGWRSYDTTTCGMHVHVSRSFVTKLDQFKLLAFFRSNVALIRRLSRRKNGESAYARLDTSSTRALCLKVKHGPQDRYEALNLRNYNTIEFRLFRGTLNPAAFRRNLSFAVAAVHFVKWAGFRQLSAEHFRVWVKVEGKHILGKADASALVAWLNECISGEPSADVAA